MHERVDALGSERNHLVRAAWVRETGIEVGSVVRITCDNATIAFRLDRVHVSQRFDVASLWFLNGACVRKDGSIGTKVNLCAFRHATLECRDDHGRWHPATPWCTEPAAAPAERPAES